MSSIGLTGDELPGRARPHWLLEAMVVVGLLAFAYFAVTVDAAATFAGGIAAESPIVPFDDLLG